MSCLATGKPGKGDCEEDQERVTSLTVKRKEGSRSWNWD